MFFYFFKVPYIAIIGDIVNSKKLDDRNAVQINLKSLLKRINEKYTEDIASNFMITLGDEFQGLLKCGNNVMNIISEIFSDSLVNSEFRRVSLFYSFFTIIYHFEFGLKDFDAARIKLAEKDYARIRNILENIESVFLIENKEHLSSAANKFIEDSRRATTDASTRERRAKYIIQQIVNG